MTKRTFCFRISMTAEQIDRIIVVIFWSPITHSEATKRYFKDAFGIANVSNPLEVIFTGITIIGRFIDGIGPHISKFGNKSATTFINQIIDPTDHLFFSNRSATRQGQFGLLIVPGIKQEHSGHITFSCILGDPAHIRGSPSRCYRSGWQRINCMF